MGEARSKASTQLDAGYAGGCVCCDLVGGLISLSEATMAQSVKGNRWGWAFFLCVELGRMISLVRIAIDRGDDTNNED